MALIALIIANYIGQISGNNFGYFAIGLVLLSIAQPQLGQKPKYEDLLELLESKSKI